MPEGDRECPQCRGRGHLRCIVYGVRGGASFSEEAAVACSFCGGTGRVPVEAAQAFAAGRAFADERKSRRVTQAQEAERLGMSVQELSRREWGRG